MRVRVARGQEVNQKQLSSTPPNKREHQVAQYRKKPVVVEALKWNGRISVPVQQLLHDGDYDYKDPVIEQGVLRSRLMVMTVDKNWVWVPIGAYIVIDAKGYPYPCDAEIFEAGHDPVEI